MGFKLTESATKELKEIFPQRVIDKINYALTLCEDTGSDIVRVDVDVNCDDYTNFMSKVQFVFSKGGELALCFPLEVNKWLPINQIDHRVIGKSIILKDKSGKMALINVDTLDNNKNSILCRNELTWYDLDDIEKFLVFEQ